MADKKKPAVTIDVAALQQANASVGTSGSPAGKAWLAAPIDNSKLGLKDANGKLLPATISGAEFQKALTNTKYNYGPIEAIKASVATLPGYSAAFGGKISATGQITPAEINAISSIVEQGYTNTPQVNGKPANLDLSTIISGIKDGSLTAGANATPWTVPSTISRTTYDQPNIEASKSLINNVFYDLLGHAASESQIAKYTNDYLAYAAKNPTNKTTGQNNYSTVSVPTATGTTTNRLFKGSQVETGVGNNLTEQAYLQNQVKNTGDFNSFQAAGTAFDLMKKLAAQNAGTI